MCNIYLLANTRMKGRGRSLHINLNKLNCLVILIKSPDDVHKLGYCVPPHLVLFLVKDTVVELTETE